MENGPHSAVEPQAPGAARRRPSSLWVGAAILILFGGVLILNEWVSQSGPQVEWLTDLDEAVAASQSSGKKLFLYVHRPNCETTVYHDSSLFPGRLVRERLSNAVCCRLEVTPTDPRRHALRFNHEPRMMVFAPGDDPLKAAPIGEPLEGRVDELRFKGYVLAND